MSFLDRFKIQPKHKSPDPEIRIAYVLNCDDLRQAIRVLGEGLKAYQKRA